MAGRKLGFLLDVFFPSCSLAVSAHGEKINHFRPWPPNTGSSSPGTAGIGSVCTRGCANAGCKRADRFIPVSRRPEQVGLYSTGDRCRAKTLLDTTLSKSLSMARLKVLLSH